MSTLTPREIVAELDKFVVGQEQAKRMVAVAVRNRWRRQHLPEELRDEVAPKNIIMMGPTGVGKTEIARRLAKLSGAPFIKVEATKFTEVGYVGRDVESMVRDLMEIGINLVREEENARVRAAAEAAAESRLLDLLLPNSFGGDRNDTREKLRQQFRLGFMDDREVEVEVTEQPAQGMDMFAIPGMEQMGNQVRDMFSKAFPPRRSRRKMKVREAYNVLIQEESGKLVDQEALVDKARERVEQMGIIFIDEIDAVGRQRGTGLGGGHDEREQTLNQLLVEMDGFESNDSVVLIAATNRADVLDPALLRPGRFDRQIVVDTPDVKGRQRILEVHSKDKPIGSDVDLAKIAKITPGFTGADLANLMNESALLTARRGKKIITMREVSESMERVIAGPERKGRVMNEKTKHTIAYHESGHALVGHLLDHADPVHKISIISRGRALGYTLSIPDEDKVLNSLSEMKDELAVFMGGRVAEEIFCDDITTGASNDLERASKMARAIVTQYGMSPLGTQVFGQPNHEVFLGRDYGNTQDYSEETARRIDEEVAKIMKEAHDRAHAILSSHADQMDLMASVLLERETVEGEACEALLDNKWDEYLAREDDIIAAKEAEEAAARAKDAELLAAQGEGDGASDTPGAPGAAPADPDAGETLADPNWRNEPVEPGDQDPNAPFRTPAEHADRADAPTQAEVNAEIDREDDMDSSADAPDPNKKD